MRHHELEDLRVTIMDKVAEWQVVRYQINRSVDKVSKVFTGRPLGPDCGLTYHLPSSAD